MEGGCSRVDDAHDKIDSEAELAALRKVLIRDVVIQENPGVKLDDVVGLSSAKEMLKNIALIALRFPQLSRSTRSVLLYGPPGSGKTMFAKSLKNEFNPFFAYVQLSELGTNLPPRGNRKSHVREIFKLAQENSPAIIVFDEIDELGSNESKYPGSLDVETEFLYHMDHLPEGKGNVVLIGITNSPWKLRGSLLARMNRRIYFPLPDQSSRESILKASVEDSSQAGSHELSQDDFVELTKITEGYSGSELKILCRDASMEIVRAATQATYFRRVREGEFEKFVPSTSNDENAEELVGGLMSLGASQVLLPSVTRTQFESALKASKRSTSKEDIIRYEQFTTARGFNGA